MDGWFLGEIYGKKWVKWESVKKGLRETGKRKDSWDSDDPFSIVLAGASTILLMMTRNYFVGQSQFD